MPDRITEDRLTVTIRSLLLDSTFGAGTKSKLERFAVECFSGPDNVREAYQESVSDNLAQLDKSSPQMTWDSVAKNTQDGSQKDYRPLTKTCCKQRNFQPSR